MVLLKSFQKLGYFPDLAEVPQPVVEHVRGLPGLEESVEPRHDSVRTAARKRDFIRERLGVVCDKERAREIASKAIYEAVQTKDNPADLINVALEKLVKARLELPGYTTAGPDRGYPRPLPGPGLRLRRVRPARYPFDR
ncbi:DUF4158 domain-containing protein [Streptomyces klenkii]|uniref:DUF4158 domain-containing protein n=1 Tax=Streptomyces klenkii TaxID=1420899 RepID=UPI003F4B8133